MEAFLQAYTEGYPLGTGGVYPESVAKQRAGSIHSGLSIQLNLGTFRAVTVRTAGINGRKPNLDFVQCALSPSLVIIFFVACCVAVVTCWPWPVVLLLLPVARGWRARIHNELPRSSD